MKLSDITIVTTSKDKLSEINEILGTNHKVSKIEIPEIQSLDLDKVITEKTKAAYKIIKKPVLVEDVSLEIKSLNGLPGTFLKFFLSTVGPEGIVKMVGNKSTQTKVTDAIGIFDGKKMKIIKATVNGTLVKKAKGKSGFGFDVVFVPRGYTKTFAQLSPSQKNKISHRAKTLQKVKKFLKS